MSMCSCPQIYYIKCLECLFKNYAVFSAFEVIYWNFVTVMEVYMNACILVNTTQKRTPLATLTSQSATADSRHCLHSPLAKILL